MRNSGPDMRSLLGLVVLLATVVPVYLASRSPDAVHLAGRHADSAVEDNDEGSIHVVDRLELDAHIQVVSARHGVSPRLVAAIIEVESEFNPRAVSPKGARGLMQLMPSTAASLKVEDLHDPFENVEGGVRHLRRLMDRYRGDLPRVLAAYNAGDAAVITYKGVPPYPETRRYVKRIMRRLGPNGGAPASVSVARPPKGTAELRRSEMAADWVGQVARVRGTAELRRADVAVERIGRVARGRGTAELRRADVAVERDAPAASIPGKPWPDAPEIPINDSSP